MQTILICMTVYVYKELYVPSRVILVPINIISLYHIGHWTLQAIEVRRNDDLRELDSCRLYKIIDAISKSRDHNNIIIPVVIFCRYPKRLSV